MDLYLKDALIRKVAAEEKKDDEKDFWARTGKGAAIGAGLGGLAGGSFLGGAGFGAAGASGASLDEAQGIGMVGGGVGAVLGAGAGATLGAVAPHIAVGLMALAKKTNQATA